MRLSLDKLIFGLKKTQKMFFVTIIMFSFACINFVFAETIPTSDLVPQSSTIISPTTTETVTNNNTAPYYSQYSQEKVYPGGTPTEPATYVGDTAPLLQYYDEQVKLYGYLNSVHEENYAYSNGNKEYNIYNGILSHVIGDFNNDLSPEMVIFRIRTTGIGELALKEIVMEVSRAFNGQVAVSDTLVISTEMYDGEAIDVNVGYKLVNDVWKFYINYFEQKVLQKEFNNKLLAIEFPDTLVTTSEIVYTGNDDIYEDDEYDFNNQVLDAGIVLKDDSNIARRSFLFDDVNIMPIFTIKRTNESMREGFMEEYMETHYEEYEKNGFVKARYGYTTFIDRTTSAVLYQPVNRSMPQE